MKERNIALIFIFTIFITFNFISSQSDNMTLEIIKNNVTFYRDNIFGNGEIIANPDGYLFEGESMELKVKVNSSQGIEYIKEVYMTVDDKIEVNCHKEDVIDDFNEIWYCHLTAETPESMYGFGLVKLVAESVQGDKYSKEIGTFFFNSELRLKFDKEIINFPKNYLGKKIYSDNILITNNVDHGSNVSLNLLITGTNFNEGDDCIGNKLPLSSISYYAENEKYSTKNDPRADKDGFIKIIESDHYDRSLNSYLILNNSLINENDSMKIRFRINVSNNCNENYSGNIYIWGKSRASSTGNLLPINLTVIKDTNPPEIKIKFNPSINKVEFFGFDDYSKNVSINTQNSCIKKIGNVCYRELVTYILKDDVGNTLTAKVNYEKINNQIKTSIIGLKYNGNTTVVKNNLLYLINNNYPSNTYLYQSFKIDKTSVIAVYNSRNNHTSIIIRNSSHGINSYFGEGLKLIEISTNHGSINYKLI